MKLATVFLITSTLAASAANLELPSEEDKKLALLLAYQANGNSMVGWGTTYDFEELKKLMLPKPLPVVPVAPKGPKGDRK